MQFIIKNNSGENILNMTRKIGYHYLGGDEQIAEYNFVRPLGGRDGFPRFHIYMKIAAADFIFNLHLDQKKPSYGRETAHSGEYDGELVEKEAERIKQII